MTDLTAKQTAALEAIYSAAPRLADRPYEMVRSLEENGFISVRLGDVGEDWTKPAERRALRKAFTIAEKSGFKVFHTDKGVGLEF